MYFIGFLRLILVATSVIILASCASSTIKNEALSIDDIEITEEYGVDAEINDKFKTAVKLIAEEKYEEAVQLLLEVTAHSNKHSAPYVNLGIAYLKLGKVEESEESLLKALKINPNHPVSNNELGIVYRKSGRFAEAKSVYLHALKLYPHFLPARKNLAILCDIFMQDLQCAIEHYTEYLKYKPNDKFVKIWLTDVTRRAGKS